MAGPAPDVSPLRDDSLRARVAAAIAPAYVLGEELGRGGMSVVFRAHDARLRRDVAIKVLPPELAFVAPVRARFLREAQTAAQLAHPHIVPIYDVSEKDGVVWIVMAIVDGETLAARLRREGRLPADEARRILGETADALAHAHAHDVVHRDVKPDNILLERGTGRVLVTDFGIARAAEGDQRLTATGVAVGTPAYMSPEQAMGEHELDARSDVYSLGVVGWHLLAGETPFSARSTPALLLKHVSEAPPALAPRAPDAPAGLVAAIERALRKRPDDRFASASDFARAVRGIGEAPPPLPASRAVADQPPTFAPAGLHGAVPRDVPLRGIVAPELAANEAELARRQRITERERRVAAREERVAEREHGVDRRVPPPLPPLPSPAAPAPVARNPRLATPPRNGDLPAWLRDAYARGDITAVPPRDESLASAALRFRARARRSLVLLAALGVINGLTSPGFPWVIFPAMGLGLGLLARWGRLSAAGLSFGDVWRGDVGALGPRGAAPMRFVRESLGARARRIVLRAKTALVAGATSLVSLAIGAPLDIEAMIAPFLIGGVVAIGALLGTISAASPMRRMGFGWKELLTGTWRDGEAARLPDVQRRLRDELVLELAPLDVVSGRHGDRLRTAADDRMAIRQQWLRLDDDTRARLADVPVTADELLARIAQLAQSLHAIDRDIGEAGTGEIERRAAELRARGQQLDEQTLALLDRQRSALAEFEARRGTLLSQLDRAALALQNLRLDVLRVRSVGQLPGDGGSHATEQARAVSRDLAYLLDGVREAERL